jgi:dolichol-phosphate mannosyltransferase
MLIPTLLDHWRSGYEVVITIRDETQGAGWLERTLSRAFYVFLSHLSETEIRPAAADFRLMSRRALDALLGMHESHRFLRGMVQWLGFPTAQVHYTAPKRAAGVSKYNFRRKAQFALDGLLSFSKAPLRISAWIGVVAFLVGGLFCGGGLIGSALGLWSIWRTLLLGSVYLMGGAMLAALGIVGEYLGRIYDEVRARPKYVIKEEGPIARAAQDRQAAA